MKPKLPSRRTHVDALGCLRSPAEVLRDDYMLPHAMTAASLARRSGVPSRVLRGILRGAPIKSAHALRLAVALNTTALYWLTLQGRYELEHIGCAEPPVREVPKGRAARTAGKR